MIIKEATYKQVG